MSLILTRSPHFVTVGDRSSETSTLALEIGTVSGGSFILDKTYNFAFRNSYTIDVSPFISDYLEDRYSYFGTFGKYVKANNDGVLYVRWTISGGGEADLTKEAYATNGYLYSNDNDKYLNDFGDVVYNTTQMLKDKSYLANSTNLMYKLDDAPIRFSLLNVSQDLLGSPASEGLTVHYYKKGDLVMSKSIVFDGSNSSSSYQFIESSQYASFENRISENDGNYEETKCIKDFLDAYKIEDYDEIRVASIHGVEIIKVKNIEECKYNPHRVTFTNRFGVLEDLWFFKRSDTSININKESYRKNSLGSYTARDGVKTFTDYNVNGREKITLNSGFVEEEMYEAFRQLLLSEEVSLYDYNNNKTYRVNLGTSELQYKQHVNDKLINYTIEFEFAHEVINNVG